MEVYVVICTTDEGTDVVGCYFKLEEAFKHICARFENEQRARGGKCDLEYTINPDSDYQYARLQFADDDYYEWFVQPCHVYEKNIVHKELP